MPVYSMTGYACVLFNDIALNAGSPTNQHTGSRLGVEIRSINSRYLDLSFRMADDLRAMEPALRERLQKRIKRGKVEVRVAVDNHASDGVHEPSLGLLERLSAVQDSIHALLPGAPELSVADILHLANNDTACAYEQPDVLALTDQAIDALLSAREREGGRLAAMLQDNIAQLRSLATKAQPLVPKLVVQQRQRFMDRWQDALGAVGGSTLPEAAHDRALAEATAFAMRIDIAEEITRLLSHFDELERLIKQGGEIGKRLDFLIQELHREANTLGSKSAALELTHISVEMKVLIEQMREQVQNIE